MKKIIRMISCALCLMLLLTGCTKKVTFKEYYKGETYEDPAPSLNKMEQISVLANLEHKESSGELLAFRDDNKTYFYNADTGAMVLELVTEELYAYDFFRVEDHIFMITAVENKQNVYNTESSLGSYAVVEEEAYNAILADLEAQGTANLLEDEAFLKELAADGIIMDTADADSAEEAAALPLLTIYDASGNEIVSAFRDFSKIEDQVSVCIDLFRFDNIIYRVAEDGTVSTVNSNPFFGSIPAIGYKADKYYYAVDSKSDSVSVYDQMLDPVLFWECPYTDFEECGIFPVDGKVFVQVLIPLLDSEDEYDLILEDGKYKLNSYIIDAKANKVKEADLDYLIISTEAASLTDERDSNKATIAMIEDSRIMTAPSAIKFVSLNGTNGGIKEEIFTDLYGTATMLVKDRFLYTMYSGDSYLIDASGKIIGKTNQISNYENVKSTQNYLLLDGKLYNYDLQLVYDYAQNNMSLYGVMGHSAIFRDSEKNYHLYTGSGTEIALAEGADMVSYTTQFCVLMSDDRYSVYNEEGTALYTDLPGTKFTVVSRDREMSIVSVTGESGVDYYRIFAAPAEK